MFTVLKVGEENYKLRLTIENLIALEKVIGKNPVTLLYQMSRGLYPSVTDIIYVLHYSLQALQHGIGFDNTVEIFERYLENGGSTDEILKIFMDVFRNAGLMPRKDGEGKNV